MEPIGIDFGAIDSAAKDASYELTSIGFYASGEVVSVPCDSCDGPALFLQMPGTGQRIELSFDAPLGPAEIHASIAEWGTGHDRLIPSIEM